MALAVKTRNPMPAEEQQYVAEHPVGMRIGIALSGGGIRSAAFNLGALQALREDGVLERAEYLTAVSGGNYVASALSISAAYGDPRLVNGKPHWAHGSAEERHLRLHTDYLAPGWVGRTWLALSVLYGFVLNYLPFLLGASLLGRLCGWLLHAAGVQLVDLQFDGLRPPASGVPQTLLVLLGCCLLVAVLLVAFRRLWDGREGQFNYGDTRSEPAAGALVGVAAAIAVGLVLPALAAQYAVVSRWLLGAVGGSRPGAFDTSWGRLEIAAIWLLATMSVAGTALLLSRRLRAHRTMLFLSSVAGAGLLLVPLLSSLEYSARHGLRSAGDVAGAGAALAVILVMAVTVHNRRYSLHLLYRERLNSAFALRRRRPDGGGPVTAEPIPYHERITFSDVGRRGAASGDRVPKLVVCCAVNLTSDEVPSGRFAESFTFEHDRSGCPLFGYHDTTRFEAHRGPAGTQLTLPSIMAVSGAALSPLMGRFTYPPVRFLMALTNVRLGVWVPNPLHRSWNGPDPAGEARGWRRARAWLVHGWHEPGALYVLREALGTLRSKHRFIYLTDGGHWENLGLVELLRRRCTHVLCFDASSDRTGDGQDLGRAIAMARSELGAQIELDPRPTMGEESGPATEMAVRGTIRYPDHDHEARMVYAKAVLTQDASWDLHAFRRRDALFPNHPTSQQMFTDEQFEAYRSLGHAAGHRAFALLNPARVLMGVDSAAAPPDVRTA